MVGSEDLLICATCGTQFDVPATEPLDACRICDDPRQYVAPGGYSWTSLAKMRGKYQNKFKQDDVGMSSIYTEPKFAIGQRCILLETESGNVLWDCITYLDDETVDFINSKGGLQAIVISHPHYYTTSLDWAKVFNCPVITAKEDEEWFCREDIDGRRVLLEGGRGVWAGLEHAPSVTIAKPGGHFPGSLVLEWKGKLLIADTFATMPSAYYHKDRPPGTTSYAFMWSYPNMIPLPPFELHEMWNVLKRLDFTSTHAAFVGTDIRDENVKFRVLESMKIQTRHMGHAEHSLLQESVSS